jgi:hypothetical protein
MHFGEQAEEVADDRGLGRTRSLQDVAQLRACTLEHKIHTSDDFVRELATQSGNVE